MRPTSTALYRSARPGRAPRVDVHLPDMPGPHPAVVLVHGGAFLLGSRREAAVRHLARFLLDAGFAVVAFDYRTLLTGGDFAAGVDDTRALLRWVDARASAYGLDPERIAVVGISSGAAIAAVAAERPWRLAGFYGPYDFTRLPLGRFGAWMVLDDTDPARLAWRSPANACRTPAPVLALHGTNDRLAPVAHAERLVARRHEQGLPARLRLFPGAGHGFLDHAGLNVWDEAAGELLSFLLDDVVDGTEAAHK